MNSPADMRLISEIALYLETSEGHFIQFLTDQFPESSIQSKIYIIPEDRHYWAYEIPDRGRRVTDLTLYQSNDGALIWIAYAKEIDTFFIRDDGGLKEFLTNSI